MAKRNIFNAVTQQLEEAELAVDLNGEIVCTFADGHFIKLPAGEDTETYVALLNEHEEANKGQVSVAQSEAAVEALANVPEAVIQQSDQAVTALNDSSTPAPAAAAADQPPATQ